MIEIAINIDGPSWKEQDPDIEADCHRVLNRAWAHLKEAGIDLPASAWLSLLLSGDDQLKALNNQFRGKNKPTNVLSFPSSHQPMAATDDDISRGAMIEILGDIAVSRETLLREAEDQGKEFCHHLTHLLVHGLLHLLGYDHEESDDAAQMEQIEIAILAGMNIANPYVED